MAGCRPGIAAWRPISGPSYMLEPQMTGMTLHETTEHLDAGGIVHQTGVELVARRRPARPRRSCRARGGGGGGGGALPTACPDPAETGRRGAREPVVRHPRRRTHRTALDRPRCGARSIWWSSTITTKTASWTACWTASWRGREPKLVSVVHEFSDGRVHCRGHRNTRGPPTNVVIPAKAGIQKITDSADGTVRKTWIPAFAGMTA